MTGFSLNRRALIGAAGSTFLASLAARARVPGGSRPNLILFFPDEMRADSLACYGNPVTRTPAFDLLAKQGTRFANCHVQTPICAASRCSMLTGLPTSATGHRGFSYLLQPDEPNLFRTLREGGYDTYFFGKNDVLAPETFARSLTDWADPPAPGAAPGDHAPGARRGKVDGPTTMLLPATGDRRATSDYGILKRAIQVIERREQDRPFCLFLPVFQPHPPYHAPDGFQDMYKPGDLPPLIPPGSKGRPAYHQAIREKYRLTEVEDAVLRQVRATYYGQVSYTDWLLGELMEALERTGRDKDTALLVSSDHGDYAGDYGLVEKWHGGLETCLTHVPMIGRVPGGVAGNVAKGMTELYDVLPTFLDLAGLSATHTNFARSMMPQLQGGQGDPERAAFTEAGMNIYEPQAFDTPSGGLYARKSELAAEQPALVGRAASVRTQRYTFVQRPQGLSELYDRQADPSELNNLIGQRSHAKVQDLLERRLLDWYINTTGVPADTRNSRDVPNFTAPLAPKADGAAATAILDR